MARPDVPRGFFVTLSDVVHAEPTLFEARVTEETVRGVGGAPYLGVRWPVEVDSFEAPVTETTIPAQKTRATSQ